MCQVRRFANSSSEAADALCVVAVLARVVADRWAMVRVVLGRDGEGTPRSIIWRFAGGGWP